MKSDDQTWFDRHFFIEKLHTELSGVLKFVKYSKDKDALQNALYNDKVLQGVTPETLDLINDVTGSDLKYKEGEELVSVCLATEEMKKEAVEAETKRIAKDLLDMGDSIEKIAAVTKLSIKEVEELAKA